LCYNKNNLNFQENINLTFRKFFDLNFLVIIDFIFPKRCIICNKKISFSWICKNCLREIEFIKLIECDRCGSPFYDRCLCNSLSENIQQVRSLFIYDNVAKELIHKWKYSQIYFIKELFEKYLIKNNYFQNFDGVMAVPLHWLKKVLRGFNQAYELSKIISDYFKIKNYSNHVKRKKYSKAQMLIENYENRKENVKGIFKILKPLECKNLLLVDDIITSCSTVNELAEELRNSNFEGNISVFTLGLAL